MSAAELRTVSSAGAPLLCEYDLEKIRTHCDRDQIVQGNAGMWNYRELLPLPKDAQPISLGEGQTPLIDVPDLARKYGVRRLSIKDESCNPTGSFKARGLSAAVSMARHLGARGFVVPSAGNAGGALAAYAARAGLPCHVFVPRDTPRINQLETALYGAQVHLVDGLIDRCGQQANAFAQDHGLFNVATLREPYRIEGKKTMGLDLAVHCDWHLPDVIVYPTGGGTGLIGMHKVFRRAVSFGLARVAAPTAFRRGPSQWLRPDRVGV